VEHFGSHYAVILHDRQLREGLVAEAEQSQPAAAKARASLRLRFGLAAVLRGLAARIEPQFARSRETTAQQPIFVE